MKTLIIIPTYNEKDNIVELVKEILRRYPHIDILVVDDNSPDLTWKRVQDAFHDHKQIQVIRKSGKMGLGAAFVTGFQFGLTHHYDYFITMDADFSHDPKEISHFLKKQNQYDIIIGSRYLSAEGAQFYRKDRLLMSKLINLFFTALFGIRCSDYTNAYRGYQRKVIKTIAPETIQSSGFSALQEILVRAHLLNFTRYEFPIIFNQRKAGKSKVSLKEMLLCALSILKFRFTMKKTFQRHRSCDPVHAGSATDGSQCKTHSD